MTVELEAAWNEVQDPTPPWPVRRHEDEIVVDPALLGRLRRAANGPLSGTEMVPTLTDALAVLGFVLAGA